MAIVYLDGGRITGLESELPAPTTTDTTDPIAGYSFKVPAGSIFIATDTGARFVHNGTAWIQQTFDSINSAFGKSDGVTQRQHMVEWFTGKSLNTNIWTFTQVTGSPTSAMADSINGGYQITGVANNNAGQITFNGNNQFSNSSVFIAVAKKDQSASAVMGGLRSTSGSTINPPSASAQFHNNSGYTNIAMTTGDASSVSASQSSTAHDQAYHCFKIELNAGASSTMTLDGVLAITKSTNIPTSAYTYQPALCFQQRSTTNANGNFLYCEAYNK